MDVGAHLRAIWVRRWWLVGLALLVAAPVLLIRSLTAPTWSASSTARVVVDGADPTNTALQQNVSFLEETYTKLATSPEVLAAAARAAGVNASYSELIDRVHVQSTPTPGFFDISATGPSPAEASALSQAVTQQLAQTVDADQRASLARDVAPLEDQLAQLRAEQADSNSGVDGFRSRSDALIAQLAARQAQATPRVEEFAPAELPQTPASPRPLREALLAFLVTFVLAAEGSVALGALGRLAGRLPRDPTEELRVLTGLPVFVVGGEAATGRRVGGFEDVRFGLLFLRQTAGQRVLTVLGVGEASRSAEMTVHLARTGAGLGGRVAIVDADAEAGMVHDVLDLPAGPGLAEVLGGTVPLPAVLRTPHGLDADLLVVTAGRGDPHVDGVLDRPGLAPTLDALPADLVVVHSAPTAAYVEALATVREIGSAVVLVVDPRRVTRAEVQDALEGLALVGATPLALLVNRLRPDEVHLLDDDRDLPAPAPGADPDLLPLSRPRVSGPATGAEGGGSAGGRGPRRPAARAGLLVAPSSPVPGEKRRA